MKNKKEKEIDNTYKEETVNSILKTNYLLYCGFILLGILIGMVLYKFVASNFTTIETMPQEIRLQKQYKFINPLLECSDSIGNKNTQNTLKVKIKEFIDKEKEKNNLSNAAVYYRDLNNGPWFGINEHILFTPASLIKVPMMMIYYKKAESDPQILQKKILIDFDPSVYYTNVSIKPSKALEMNKEYSVDELINQMIIYSDNAAYNILKGNISENEFNEVFNDFGIDILTKEKSPDGNVLSILEYATFFRILYNSSYLDRYFSEKALNLLSQIDFKDGMEAGIPVQDNIKIAHKFGEKSYDQSNDKQFHDCGIVYKTNNPYLLCIMTRGNDSDKLIYDIRTISTMVYNSLEK